MALWIVIENYTRYLGDMRAHQTRRLSFQLRSGAITRPKRH